MMSDPQCERCNGRGVVDETVPNRFDPDYRDDVELVCPECEESAAIMNMNTTTQPQTFKDWLTKTLEPDQLSELVEHGADAGWPGLTYTSDCVELHDRFEREIWDALYEDAQDFGYDSSMAFVATFGRSDMTNDPDQLKNLLVWYMAERVAREMEENE